MATTPLDDSGEVNPTGLAARTLRSSSLAVDISGVSKSFGSTPVLREVSLRTEPGAMVALLGPSGCGKTTLLRIIAGLEEPDEGEVRVGDRLLTGGGTTVPPEHRRIGMVFQDWALFPHLTVARNVSYGLSREQVRAGRVDEALAMVGLGGLGERMPSMLSGGQQQRVALARAIAPAPSVLLLDEPFSNLDAALRVQVRSEVHALLVGLGITTIFVTHDQEEAFVLGDEVAVMHDGRIVQQASPAEIYRGPATAWVAGFVGEANLLEATATTTPTGTPTAETAIGTIALTDGTPVGPVRVLVRPEQIRLEEPAPSGPTGIVALIEYYGHDTIYVVDVAGTPVRVREGSGPRFPRGDTVGLRYRADAAVAYPASS